MKEADIAHRDVSPSPDSASPALNSTVSSLIWNCCFCHPAFEMDEHRQPLRDSQDQPILTPYRRALIATLLPGQDITDGICPPCKTAELSKYYQRKYHEQTNT